MHRILQQLKTDRILGAAAVLAITQLGASVMGLLRDRMLDATFPGLGVVDAYVAAFRPSDLLFQVGVMSALGTVFVPLLASHKAHGRRYDMDKVLTGTMMMGGMFFGILALLLAVFFPWIAHFFVNFEGEKLVLYIRFGQLALLTNLLFVFANAFGQYLISEQRYWVYGLTPIVYSLGTVAGTVWLTPVIGPYGPMAGTLIGAVLYTLWRFASVFKLGWRPTWGWHPDLRSMGILMLPRMLALGALQLQLLLFDKIGSGLAQGSVTINYATRNFQGVLVGVAGVALAQSVYSILGQTAALREMHRFRAYVRKGSLMILVITIPASLALVILTPVAAEIVKLSHVGDAFRWCLILYALSVPFESLAHLLLRAFYSLKNTMIPAVLGVTSGLFAVGVAAVLAPRYGLFALPLGYLLGQAAETVILWIMLKKRMR